MAHAGNNDDLRAVLGTETAIKSFLESKLPCPDGTVIVRPPWGNVASEENDKLFGCGQSFVAGSAITYVGHGFGKVHQGSGCVRSILKMAKCAHEGGAKTESLRSRQSFGASFKDLPGFLLMIMTPLPHVRCGWGS